MMKFNEIKLSNVLLVIAFASLFIGVALICYYTYLYCACVGCENLSITHINESFVSSLRDNPGEFIGGTIGVLFTFTATIFLFITFKEQRDQFKITKQTEYYTLFETTYFNMLNMLAKVEKSVDDNIRQSKSSASTMIEYYRNFKKQYDNDLQSNNEIITIEEGLSEKDLQISVVQKASQYYGDYFKDYVMANDSNIGYYYRYIYNVVKFVYDQYQFADVQRDRKKYLNLLQAQLSDEEMALIFYDAISDYGENKEGKKLFHDILDEVQFLENVKPESLLNKNHCFFYTKTGFAFLSQTDKEKALCLVS